jgi:glycosyltransferase involved in cell wall biosynthesis
VQGGTRLLCVFGGEHPGDRPAFSVDLEARGWAVDYSIIKGSTAARIAKAFRPGLKISAYDVVATNEYFLTWALCLRLLLSRSRPRLVALSFNQSSTRVIRTGFSPIDRVLNRLWRRATLFLVHSKAEAALFARLHDIPIDRFVFSHWGFDLPAFAPGSVRTPLEPYVTMIGRNNRDIAGFCKAVQSAGVRGILITAGYMVSGTIDPPENVDILVDRPLQECLAYLDGSFAHLVLVVDSDRGAGHISAVSAMLLGKPQIFSNVAPLADYLIDDFNALAVPIGDSAATANAIRRLKDDPKLAQRLGSAGRSFALECMSHRASARRIADALIAVAG